MQDCQSCIFTQFFLFSYPPRGDFWLIYMITQSVLFPNWSKKKESHRRKSSGCGKYQENKYNIMVFSLSGEAVVNLPGPQLCPPDADEFGHRNNFVVLFQQGVGSGFHLFNRGQICPILQCDFLLKVYSFLVIQR